MTESKYLFFSDVTPDGRATKIISVCSQHSGDRLAQIKWFGRWHQYCFYPEPGTIFNKGCLSDINDRIDTEMRLWRASKRAKVV